MTRVYDSRPLPLQPKATPSISIFKHNEKSSLMPDGETMERKLSIQIEALICTGNLGSDMDTFAEQIESAMLLNRRLADPDTGIEFLADDLLLTGTDTEVIDTDAGFGGIRMMVETTYYTQYAAEPAPGPITQLPTEVFVTPNPTPILYEEVTGRDMETGDNLASEAQQAPSTIIGVSDEPTTNTDELAPAKGPDYVQAGECGPEGCDVPAWGGDA
jgi:hypothetical protein